MTLSASEARKIVGRIPEQSGREAVEWMARMASGDLTPQETRQFEAWRQASPENLAAWTRMSEGLRPFRAVQESVIPRGAVVRWQPEDHPDRRSLLLGVSGLIAAATLSAAITQSVVPLDQILCDRFTNTGEQVTVQVNEACQVTIAPRSSINLSSSTDLPDVRLMSGQIMAHLMRDHSPPTTISVDRMVLQTDGGSFNVDRRGRQVSFTALRGEATISTDAGSHALAEGERLSFGDLGYRRQRVDAVAEASWTTGQLVVRDEPIASVVDRIRPYFTGVIRLNPDSTRRNASGVFDLFAPIASLTALAQSLSLPIRTTAGLWVSIG